jgi:hypothetical protein
MRHGHAPRRLRNLIVRGATARGQQRERGGQEQARPGTAARSVDTIIVVVYG